VDRDELGAWLRLTLTPGVGNTLARKLLAAFGLPQAIFSQPVSALRQVVSASVAEQLRQSPGELPALLDHTLSWQEEHESDDVVHLVVTLGDALYPPALLQLDDPPLMLYLMGQASACAAIDPTTSLAMVGSRNPTPQGATNARQFAKALAQSGLTIVSGLALGIDGAAHEGALQGFQADTQLATIAVVGTGLDRVYPRAHHALAHQIARHGVLISEYPLGTPPLTANFPRRNRLIAGLSSGVLVVEAALRSGSLITARLAAEQGKDVFAIPGSIHSTQSRGCHALIRQGAKLVESAQDVLEELRGPGQPGNPQVGTSVPELTTSEPDAPDPLLHALGHDAVGLDALQARTGWSAADLQARLMTLELDGEVARLPGGLFQRQSHSR